MKKVELALQNIEWSIEEEEKTIEEMRQSIKGTIDSQHLELDADFILGYARRMDEAAKKLVELRETKRMLEFLAKED